jgi:hypothetical protein
LNNIHPFSKSSQRGIIVGPSSKPDLFTPPTIGTLVPPVQLDLLVEEVV